MIGRRSAVIAWRAGVLGALAILALAGCAPEPLLPFDVHTPPAIVTAIGPGSGSAGERIEDRRGRFRQIVCAVNEDHGAALPDYRPCENILWGLYGEPAGEPAPVHLGLPRLPIRIIFVGGLAAECVSGFVSMLPYAFKHLNSLGYPIEEFPVPGFGSTSYNGRLIATHILATKLRPNEKLVLVGYSKGAADILDAVAQSPEAARRVAAVVSVAGAINGSPLVETAPKQLFLTLRNIPVEGCRIGDGEGIDSLKRDRRLRWMVDNRLPESIRYYSLAGFTNREGISLAMRANYDRLSLIDPRNDGQLLYYDQIIPQGVLLGYANADHWAVTMPINRIYPTLSQVFATRAAFPREVLLEAIVRNVEEDLMREQQRPPGEPPNLAGSAPAS